MKYQELLRLVEKHKDEDILDIIEIICDDLGENDLFDHLEQVASIASSIAENYGLDLGSAHLAGFLHDIGRLIDEEEYVELLEKNNIEVCDDEKLMPDVLHGKVSKLICEKLLNISDETILLSVMNHTALRRSSTESEKVIFLAEKMTWDDENLVFIIDETVMQTLNVTCYNALDWLIKDIEKKGEKALKQTMESYDYFKGLMLF